jgi:hypothetical protein
MGDVPHPYEPKLCENLIRGPTLYANLIRYGPTLDGNWVFE